jgi:hypothetical protein
MASRRFQVARKLAKWRHPQVGPGEVLYLPAMWHHRVAQECSQSVDGHDYVIAVNMWWAVTADCTEQLVPQMLLRSMPVGA